MAKYKHTKIEIKQLADILIINSNVFYYTTIEDGKRYLNIRRYKEEEHVDDENQTI